MSNVSGRGQTPGKHPNTCKRIPRITWFRFNTIHKPHSKRQLPVHVQERSPFATTLVCVVSSSRATARTSGWNRTTWATPPSPLKSYHGEKNEAFRFTWPDLCYADSQFWFVLLERLNISMNSNINEPIGVFLFCFFLPQTRRIPEFVFTSTTRSTFFLKQSEPRVKCRVVCTAETLKLL